jgi:peptidoglycan/xylan/chitin deacetylase (PgdA/CDA1 family)
MNREGSAGDVKRIMLSRRALALALVGISVGGAVQDERQKNYQPSEPNPPEPPPAGPEPVLPASLPTQPARPSRDQIIARFGNLKPQRWGLSLPGTATTLNAGAAGIALTFDCCGGPGGNAWDTKLLDVLRSNGTPAMFFLNSRWVQANPALARDIAGDPLFEVGNHGTRHLPLSVSGQSAYGIPGTRNAGEVYDEVMGNQDVLTAATGKVPRFFRPGTAYFDDVSIQLVRALGLIPTDFSLNADGGATFPAGTVAKTLQSAGEGHIVIAHANHPLGGTAAGFAKALPVLKSRGAKFVRLSDSFPA